MLPEGSLIYWLNTIRYDRNHLQYSIPKMINIIRGIVVEAAHVFVENITLAGIAVVKKEYPNGKLRNKLFKYDGEKVDLLFGLDGHYKNWNIESFLPDILCPCLTIQGEKDEYGSLRQVAAIEQGIPGQTKTAILQHTGHIPHHEQQDITLNHTCNFIKQLITDEKH
jgi:pimeloyl-ACP methyl ester carboxylesterase